MKDAFTVKDDFCDKIDFVRDSALAGGFGTVTPETGEIGKKTYDGMGFLGRHDIMLECLTKAIGGRILPGSMFFRVTKPTTEKACVHSDREHGDWTCVVYMSDHPGVLSGTGFFRHKRTKWTEMPSVDEMKKYGLLDKMNESMSKHEDWEQTDFVAAAYNRALIFRAPLFHARTPLEGLGDGTDATARMCWICHFRLMP